MEDFSIADIETYAALVYKCTRDDLYLEPYGYPISFTSLSPGQTQSGIINLSANADFITVGLSHFSLPEDGGSIFTKFAPNVRALLTDTSSGDPFTQNASLLENWSANGLGVCNFTFPRLLRGRGAVSVQVTNVDTTTTYPRLELFLRGVLVKQWSQAPQTMQV